MDKEIIFFVILGLGFFGYISKKYWLFVFCFLGALCMFLKL